jgi:hypothetical protein
MNEITALNNTPLDEGPGESVHRISNLTLSRASASRMPWVMGSIRHKQNLKTCSNFITDHGEAGKNVFRYEWTHYKRVLRPSNSNRFQSVRMTDQSFYRKLYKLDDDGDDWSDIKCSSPSVPNARPLSSTDKCKAEYLSAVFVEGKYCSFPVTCTAVGDDGVPAEETKPMYFQVVQLLASGRSKLVPTTNVDEEDIAKACKFAVSIQHLDVWEVRSDRQVTASFETDPAFVNILDIGSFNDMRHNLTLWETGPSDTEGCLDLVSPVQAVPDAIIGNDGCPVMVYLDYFREHDWLIVFRQVKHSDLTKEFDGREIHSKSLYCQVVYRIGDYFGANAIIPSGRPQSYYKLVLNNISVACNLSDKQYRAMLLDGGCDDAILPAIEDEGPARPALQDADTFDLGGGESEIGIAPRRVARHRKDPRAIICDRPPEPPPDPPAHSSSSTSNSDSSSSDSESEVIDPFDVGGRSKVSQWTYSPFADCPRMKMDMYKPRGKTSYRRVIGECKTHPGCFKKRSTQQTALYGAIETFAFVAAWNEAGVGKSAAEHKSKLFVVPDGLIAKWAVTLRGDAGKSFRDLL